MSVYCYDLARTKSTFWTKARDELLRQSYNDKIKVCPAILAMELGVIENSVINRLSQLGLRSRRTERNVLRRHIA
jgi:hypothetical protein